jgi:hypothetical protein
MGIAGKIFDAHRPKLEAQAQAQAETAETGDATVISGIDPMGPQTMIGRRSILITLDKRLPVSISTIRSGFCVDHNSMT